MRKIWSRLVREGIRQRQRNAERYEARHRFEREKRATQEIRHRICEQHNRIPWLIGALSKTDPTTAARLLLKRVDIAAENIGDLLKMFPCKKAGSLRSFELQSSGQVLSRSPNTM
uniref:Transposase n=1 Tax=Ascaris lumbricoides TaxID=6252 RepID=A0A0M3HVY4_ASCLU